MMMAVEVIDVLMVLVLVLVNDMMVLILRVNYILLLFNIMIIV